MGIKDYTNVPESIEELPTAKYHEAFFKNLRFHKLNETINLCSINPLAFNPELNLFNYEIIISCLNSLLTECWGKLIEDEKKEALKFREDINNLMEKYPIHDFLTDSTNGKSNVSFNRERWNILKEVIFKYELKIKELLSRTGYDGPNKDEFDDDDF